MKTELEKQWRLNEWIFWIVALVFFVLWMTACREETVLPNNFPHTVKIIDGDVLHVQIDSDLPSVRLKVGNNDWGTVIKQWYRCSSYRGFTGGRVEVCAEECSYIIL